VHNRRGGDLQVLGSDVHALRILDRGRRSSSRLNPHVPRLLPRYFVISRLCRLGARVAIYSHDCNSTFRAINVDAEKQVMPPVVVVVNNIRINLSDRRGRRVVYQFLYLVPNEFLKDGVQFVPLG
jgi:hypothetical protein